jgi:S-DNA-T family DNA segregation ATPase FtsK/SpoIIIE
VQHVIRQARPDYCNDVAVSAEKKQVDGRHDLEVLLAELVSTKFGSTSMRCSASSCRLSAAG